MRALLIDTPANLKTVASTTVKQKWFSDLGLSSKCLVFRQDFNLSVLFFWPHTYARSSQAETHVLPENIKTHKTLQQCLLVDLLN